MKPESDKDRDRTVSEVPTVSSRDLLNGGHRINIEHDGEIYQINVTRRGKLILIK
ncbi:MAG: hypothetical protein CMM52_01535 [Rhodospirillaceae bacterium]|nr:hypothetical protein [Rhodospirillaceae bacterium]